MRGASDEINFAIAQRLVAAVHRKDQLGRDIEPLIAEAAEFGRGHRREIRVRDQVRDRELHRIIPSPIAVARKAPAYPSG